MKRLFECNVRVDATQGSAARKKQHPRDPRDWLQGVRDGLLGIAEGLTPRWHKVACTKKQTAKY